MKKNYQHYIVQGGHQSGRSNPLTRPIEFRYLSNCYVNRILGRVLGRGGSSNLLSSQTGRAIGIGELQAGGGAQPNPTSKSLLLALGSSNWKKSIDNGSSWTSVTADDNTDFTNAIPHTMAELAGRLFIAGGRPARWNGSDGIIERVGIPAPETAPTVATGGAGSLDGTYYYMYTFYNSNTGLESDWSPVSDAVSPSSQEVDISGLETSVAARDVTHVVIYRTDADVYRYVTMLPLGSTSYTDDTATASLGAESADQGDHALPPDYSFVCMPFAGRMWWTDDSDPYIAKFSKPYVLDSNEVEYCPVDNIMVADRPITGMIQVENKALIFHPRAISYVSGATKAEFRLLSFYPGIGTLFPHSISTHGGNLIFLAEEGWTALIDGGIKLIDGVNDFVLPMLADNELSHNIYASSTWNPHLRQFVCSLCTIESDQAIWEDENTHSWVSWEDDSTSSATSAQWEDELDPYSNRVSLLIFGWSPDTDTYSIYTFDSTIDTNDHILKLFTPGINSTIPDPQQDFTIALGDEGLTTSPPGEGTGFVSKLFDSTSIYDSGENVLASWLTGRIVPGEFSGRKKRFKSFSFNDYDPRDDNALLYSSTKSQDGGRHITPTIVASDFVALTDVGEQAVVSVQKASFIHLLGRVNLASVEQTLLEEFGIFYRDTPSYNQE